MLLSSKVTPVERDTLDLSHWQAAGNAVEPINPEVIEEFCQMFKPCGFHHHTFAPAYGLAEAIGNLNGGTNY